MTTKQLEHYLTKITAQQGDSSLKQLEVFLRDKKASNRKVAVKALGNISFQISKRHVFKMSLDASISVAREAIAIAERNLSDPDAKRLLKAFLDKSTHQKLRQEVSQKLEVRESAPQLQQMDEKIFQVSEFSQFMNGVFPEEVRVEGELSAVQTSSHYANQWVFFDLKDETKEAKIRCFSTMYKIRASQLSLVDGMRVIVTARPRISVKSGIFSLNVEKVELSGEGQLLKAFELLKAKLEKEGLFSPDRKRSTPEYPSNIGLITSKDAAAFKDFTKVLKHRMGGLKVHFHHAQVQGAQAESSIVKAIETLSTYPLDLIVLTRGGGAMDDLHAFNSEEVARAIYTSSIPIVSAVGHERDITIADYVADIRASTPSNAAEIIVKDREHLLKSISRLENSIEFELAQNIRHKKERMQTLISYVNSGYYQIKDSYQVVQNRVEMFELSLKTRLENRTNQTHQNQSFIIDQVERLMYDSRQKLDFMERFIQVNNYKKNLKKGYSILRKNGTIVTSTQDVSRGDSLDVEVFDGKIQTKVQNNT